MLRAPVVQGRRSARGAVIVEANLFSRAVRVIQSYANQIGEREPPYQPAPAWHSRHTTKHLTPGGAVCNCSQPS